MYIDIINESRNSNLCYNFIIKKMWKVKRYIFQNILWYLQVHYDGTLIEKHWLQLGEVLQYTFSKPGIYKIQVLRIR